MEEKQQNSRRRAKILSTTLVVCVVLLTHWLCRADAVDWPALGFTQVVPNTFSAPTSITHAGDNSGRLFVLQQSGLISIIQSNSVLPQPFLNIQGRVLTAGAEQGLLGLAFPPGYATNSHFYVDYTRQTDGAVVISRFFLTGNPNVGDTNSEQIIKVIPKPYNNHNAGQLAFGPDGYLYVGVGDGGSEGDPQNYGQTTSTLLGKILRIDVESGVSPYAIPTNNPFVGNTNYSPEIWALGLRNPWRFSFDRSTGDLYIADVGQNLFEEIDFQAAGDPGGENYGWRIVEGPTNYNVPSGFTNFSALTPPVTWYDHRSLPSDGAGAVIGGYVYRGPSEPRMDGVYFFADFMAGWIWGLKRVNTNWQSFMLLTNGLNSQGLGPYRISTFGEDDQGKLYLADYYQGIIYQMGDTHQVLMPTFSPANGTINSNLVTVGCLTIGADIHYTTNGLDPTQSDPVVASGTLVQVSSGITNKLRAFRSDLTASGVAVAVFTNTVGTPFFIPPTGAVANGTLISIGTVTPGATIYYTTNGSTPNTTNSLLYTGPIPFTNNLSLQALGVEIGCSNSFVASATYSEARTATPSFGPASGPITNGTPVTISCATPGSTIYFTTNGTTPTTNSQVYSGPVIINGNTTLNAFATADLYFNSALQSVLYSLVPAASPTFSPSQGPLTNGALISISCTIPNAAVYYTIDGSTPTSNSLIYNGPITFTNPTTLNAVAFADQFNPSPVASTFFGLLDLRNTVVTTFAGAPAAGYLDAPAALARFSSPSGVTMDAGGNLYVADTGNSLIRKISPSGQVTTIGGTGVFSGPTGVCLDNAGNIYVADNDNCNRICRIDTNGIVTTIANVKACGYTPGLWQIRMGVDGNLYLGWRPFLYQVLTNGTVNPLASLDTGGWGLMVGAGIDAATNVYSANGDNLWRTTPGGATALFSGGITNFSDGPRLLAGLPYLNDASVDAFSNIYLSDTVRIRKMTPDGWVATLAGIGVAGYKNGRGSLAQFNNAGGICTDTNGNVYVADTGNNCIRKVSPDTAGIGIADDWQLAHFGYIGIDPNADPDHDGMSNFEEFWAGTDPLDSTSVLAINSASLLADGMMTISWQSVAGKSYTVRYSTDLVTWNDLAAAVNGDGSILSVTDPTPVQQSGQRFYRIFLSGF